MPRHNDHSPIGYTCPMIDGVISKMESAIRSAEYVNDNPNEDISDEAIVIISELQEAILEMESIRTANQTLRDWGNIEYRNLQTAEESLIEAEEKMEQLENEIEELKREIEELTNQLTERQESN